MNNILITSVGRRTKLIEYFKREFLTSGKVVVTDSDRLAPALYLGDKYYIVPKIDEDNYIYELLQICKKENIKAITSLIDPELTIISKNSSAFEAVGVKVFVSKPQITERCFNKYKMYKFLLENNINTAKSYLNLYDFKRALEEKKISFPVFVKPVKGSASINVNKVKNMEALELIMKVNKGLLIQEFMEGTEYGVDVYTDIISKKIVSIFIKEKIKMRAGETDKSKSVIDEKLFSIITDFVLKLGTIGPIDIDVFKIKDRYYISEVNPRFGGGYPHAYECGINFPRFMLNNMNGIINNAEIGKYKENVYLLKQDDITIVR